MPNSIILNADIQEVLAKYIQRSDLAHIGHNVKGDEVVACPGCAESFIMAANNVPYNWRTRPALNKEYCDLCSSINWATAFIEQLGGWVGLTGDLAAPRQLWLEHLEDLPPEVISALSHHKILET